MIELEKSRFFSTFLVIMDLGKEHQCKLILENERLMTKSRYHIYNVCMYYSYFKCPPGYTENH